MYASSVGGGGGNSQIDVLTVKDLIIVFLATGSIKFKGLCNLTRYLLQHGLLTTGQVNILNFIKRSLMRIQLQ